MVFVKLLISSYKQAKFSLLMLLLSLVIATTGLSAVLIINNSAKQSYSSSNEFLIPNVSHQIIAKSEDTPITTQDYVFLKRSGVPNLVAIAQQSSYLFKDGQSITPSKIEFTGVDNVSLFPILISLNLGEEEENSQPTNIGLLNGTAIVHQKFANLLGSDLSELTIDGQSNQRLDFLSITTLNEPTLGNDMVMDLQDYFKLFPNASLSRLLLVSKPELKQRDLDLIQQWLPEHLKIESLNNDVNNQELTNSFHLNLVAMALLMFVVCLFIVLNSANLLINSRMGWFKVCRQLGIPRKTIFNVQLIEILTLGFVATLIGIVVSVQLVNFVSPTVQATLEGLSGKEVGFGNTSFISLLVQVFSITAIGCILAIAAPLIKTNQQLSTTKAYLSNIKLGKQALYFSCLTAVLASICALLLITASSLMLLLIASAVLILAGCSAMLASYPLILKRLAAIVPSNMPLLKVSSQQSVLLCGKTKIACCAFFIAATSNIGMNLMVDSFRLATQSWLESRLASDYYLYSDEQINLVDVENKTGVVLTPRIDSKIIYKDQSIQLFSYPTTQQFKDAMVFSDVDNINTTWEKFENGSGVMVNQQFAYSLGYQLGDNIRLPHPSTDTITNFTIVGIIYDYGNPFKQALLPIGLFDTFNGDTSIYAVEASSSQITKLDTYFASIDIDTDDYRLYKVEDLLALSMQTFDQTFLITDGLNVVTLLVASFSLACAMIVLMHDDRPHNMLIRSFGIGRIKTQLLSLYQYLLLCIVGLLFATPFGILLSWVLIYKINLQAFNWTYPLIIDGINILMIYSVSIFVVLCVVILPFIRASKRPIIEDIRWLN